MVSRILFRTIHIRFPSRRNATGHQLALLEQDGCEKIYPHVRALILSNGPPNDKGGYGDLIYRLVENLPNLEIIRCEES